MSSSQTPQQKIQLPDEELDWIQMRIESGPVFPETTKEKMMRKIKSNPLVPIGKTELFYLYKKIPTSFFDFFLSQAISES